MELAIEKYSEEYNVPKNIAYGIAYKETTYRGINDTKYNPARRNESSGALGPMQIMPRTARLIEKDNFLGNQILRDSLEYNVMISMKLFRDDLNRIRDIKKTIGCYNTGKPIVNSYAEFVYRFDPSKYHI